MSQADAGRFGPYRLTTAPGTVPTGDTVAQDVAGNAVWLRAVSDDWARDPARRAAFDADRARLLTAAAPGIVTGESIVTEGTRTAVALDAPTATLVDLTAGGRRYPTHQAARMGIEIADALAAAHRAGVVHGALTPDAVVQAPDGHLQLRHFGFASDPLAITDAAAWTAYAAPEQLLDGPPDPRSDLYALGALLFLLVTGGPPFPDFDQETLRRRKLEEAPPAPSRDEPMVPAALDGLVQRLLARDPTRRPDGADTVSAELRRLAQPTEVVAPVRRTVVEELATAPEERTNAWPFVAAILGTLLIVAIVLVVVLANDDGGSDRVTVPVVTGRTAADAAATLTREHLGVTTVDRADAVAPVGQVTAQDPAAGSHVKRDRVVVLTVSSGAPAITPVPIPIPVTPTAPSTTTSSSTTTTTTTTTTTAPAPPP